MNRRPRRMEFRDVLPENAALKELYRKASLLALITIFYNLAEGIISVWFGAADETISLFGFGLDSFVEVMSGIGIWHMVRGLARGILQTATPSSGGPCGLPALPSTCWRSGWRRLPWFPSCRGTTRRPRAGGSSSERSPSPRCRR